MAISYTQNGITFDNIINGEGALPSKYGNANNGDFSLAQYTGVQPFVNAVEIDWNAANLGNYVNIDANGVTSEGNSAEINTTGRMLSCLSTLA